jgi:hypothetical protein
MAGKTHKAARCAICGATVIVWKRGKLSAKTLRALAVADHIAMSHPVQWAVATGRMIDYDVTYKCWEGGKA